MAHRGDARILHLGRGFQRGEIAELLDDARHGTWLPERREDWWIVEDAERRFGVKSTPLHQDEAAWRWQLWGGVLAQIRPLDSLHKCRQAGLNGIDFRSGEMSTRLLLGPKRVHTLCVITLEGDWRGAAFLNSFRAVSK
ncbi:MAG: hypothetical protein KF760_04150 [Candidatus Eremiobacteraeota bacterium]|nr:hypothetical protein [Candidatus Eremiobacteraeota bacterium]MCW5867107.1 hypothetical protein [Candidatus Eremiobacteraeota bacterium]